MIAFGSLLLLLLMPCIQGGKEATPLKASLAVNLDVPEPSDFCFDGMDSIFVVSDRGALYKCSVKSGKSRLLLKWGSDLEGICMTGSNLLLVDERYRQIAIVSKDSRRVDLFYELPYQGARNSGFESIAWLENTEQYVLVTEKDPCVFHLLDSKFKQAEKFSIKGISEVSSIIRKERDLYVLSDEERTIYRVNEAHEISKMYTLSIWNPEGIAFDDAGNCWVLSDDLARIYNLGKLND